VAVAAAVSAASLLAASSALAALGATAHVTTPNRPDLVSATVTDSTDVVFCFDKNLNSTFLQTGSSLTDAFYVGGYRTGHTHTPGSVTFLNAATNCVDATFPTKIDTGQLTYATVVGFEGTGGSPVVSTYGGNSANNGNNTDSVPITYGAGTPGSHEGTRGLTVAPNLIGPGVLTSSNTQTNSVTFNFDKWVNYVNPTDFYIEDAAGNKCFGGGDSSGSAVQNALPAPIVTNNSGGGSNVTVYFPGGSGTIATDAVCNSGNDNGPQGQNGGPNNINSVSSAVMSGVYGPNPTDSEGGVNAWHYTSNWTTDSNGPIPGSSGLSAAPDLVPNGATVVNSDTIDFKFAHPVTITDNDGDGFFAALAGGRQYKGTSDQVIGDGTVVEVTFAGLNNLNEFAVKASVAYDAVSDLTDSALHNQPGSNPVNGNIGAFADGFTTGPDVTSLTINRSTATVTATVDDRIDVTTANSNLVCTSLLDANGDFLAHPNPGGVGVQGGVGPGPEQITISFPAAYASVGQSVQFLSYQNCSTGNGSLAVFGDVAANGGSSCADTSGQSNSTSCWIDSSADPANADQIDPFPSGSAILRSYRADRSRLRSVHVIKHNRRHKR
jgi:hypothetical protein